MTIYTAGYRDLVFAEFSEQIKKDDYLVIDVRYAPYSKMFPFWTKKHLQKALGNKYIHLKSLGNTNFNSAGEISIESLDDGLSELFFFMDLGFKCIILCACSDFDSCHRKIIIEEIQSIRRCEVVHWGSEYEIDD